MLQVQVRRILFKLMGVEKFLQESVVDCRRSESHNSIPHSMYQSGLDSRGIPEDMSGFSSWNTSDEGWLHSRFHAERAQVMGVGKLLQESVVDGRRSESHSSVPHSEYNSGSDSRGIPEDMSRFSFSGKPDEGWLHSRFHSDTSEVIMPRIKL